MTVQYVCWHPLLTEHQAQTYAALREIPGVSLFVNVWRTEDPVRKAQGWVRETTDKVPERFVPQTGWRAWTRRVLEQYPDAIHVFGSPFENMRQVQVMATACRMGFKVAIISEPFSTASVSYLSDRESLKDRAKAILRPLLYKGYGVIFARRLFAVFAISPKACEQYLHIGVPEERIFPFGYFVHGADVPSQNAVAATGQELRLVFLGGLIPRKGLAIAAAAVQSLRNQGYSISLDVYGAGDPLQYNFSHGVSYKGVAPFGRAGEVIADYDALVLPSLFDGWGVVVNEALQAGIPVCCSDSVGAGAVVAAHKAGASFANGDAADLAETLRAWCDEPALLDKARAGARQVAPLLAPQAAASYFHQAIAAASENLPAPAVPWYSWRSRTKS